MALLPLPRRFQGGTWGCTLPAASVARARRLCRPRSVASHANDQSCHWYGPLGGSTCAVCQSPSPVTLTSTLVIGPVPDQAFPAHFWSTTCAMPATVPPSPTASSRTRPASAFPSRFPSAPENARCSTSYRPCTPSTRSPTTSPSRSTPSRPTSARSTANSGSAPDAPPCSPLTNNDSCDSGWGLSYGAALHLRPGPPAEPATEST